MAASFFTPDGTYVEETGTFQAFLPGGAYLNQSLVVGGPKNIVQVGAIAVIGTLANAAQFSDTTPYWIIPTNAGIGTSMYVIVFSGSAAAGYSIVSQGAATVLADGYAYLPGAVGTIGSKAFAFAHNYSDNTAATSIFGGPAIATRYNG